MYRIAKYIALEQVFNQKIPDNITFKELYNSYNGIPFEGEKLYSYSFSSESGAKFISEINDDYWDILPPTDNILYFFEIDT